MATDKLKRVMWRIKEKNPTGVFTRKALDRAIMLECGVHPQTLKYNKSALLKIGWIKHWHYNYKIAEEFAVEDYA